MLHGRLLEAGRVEATAKQDDGPTAGDGFWREPRNHGVDVALDVDSGFSEELVLGFGLVVWKGRAQLLPELGVHDVPDVGVGYRRCTDGNVGVLRGMLAAEG